MSPSDKPSILAYLNAHSLSSRAALAVFLVGMAVTAVAVVTPGMQADPLAVNVVEALPQPMVEYIDSDEQPFVREGTMQKGDTLSTALARMGVQDQDLHQYVASSAEARDVLRSMRPGLPFVVTTSRLGRLYSISIPQQDREGVLMITRRVGGFHVTTRPMQLEPRVRVASGEIRNSLFGATDEIGLPDSVATGLADIFGGNIDFHRDLRKGDRFSVVYELLYHNGTPVRSGRVLAAEFLNDGKRYSAVWHIGMDGRGEYYSADGRPMRAGFLRSPLEFSRVSSGFSLRFHPILKQWRAHKGVDYAAPTGTRVRATADGVVDFMGQQGGYGNLVVLRHDRGYTTAYAHLNGFARGLRRGMRVAQGELVGYVGSTGWATGPHLHYEFRDQGVQKDPLRIALPQAAPLMGAQLSAFRDRASGVLAQLALARNAGATVAIRD